MPELRDIWAAACEAVQATDTQRALKLFHTAIMLHTEVPQRHQSLRYCLQTKLRQI